MACDELNEQSKKRKSSQYDQGDQASDGKPSCGPKQIKLDAPQVLTQQRLDDSVMDYIIQSVLPVYHVETPPFVQFVGTLTGGKRPRCRQTLTKQLEKRFATCKEELKQKLATVDFVCTTADCWSSRRRGFLGMTVHWIDNSTMERKGACLAVKQLTGKHTYDVLAKEMEAINNEFEITHKTVFTVTDSGSNFIKSFKLFALDDDSEQQLPAASASAGGGGATSGTIEALLVVGGKQQTQDQNEEDDSDDVELMEFHAIDELLIPPNGSASTTFNTTSTANEEQVVYKLPPHRRCACHTLNLIPTNDVSTPKLANSAMKRISIQTFAKLSALWNKQNRSTQAAETILANLGTLFVTPVETRWNSYYDSVARVQSVLSTPGMEAKVDKVFDELGIQRLLTIQKSFIAEYVKVMAPLANGLDILQGENAVSLGYLVPTVTVIVTKLQKLLSPPPPPQGEPVSLDQLPLQHETQSTNEWKKLEVCESLAEALVVSVKKRFTPFLDDADAQLAAAVHPKFKLDWVEDVSQKTALIDLLRRRVASISQTESNISQPAQRPSEMEISRKAAGDFFAILSEKRRASSQTTEIDEVTEYLKDTSEDIQSLNKYPHIRQLFLRYNTGLPSSAAVERLFSLGGRIFAPLRTRMSSSHFEMMMFMRVGKY